LKRWSAVGLFCNFQVPIQRCTLRPGFDRSVWSSQSEVSELFFSG
jgi:hypothetical protein